MDTLVLVFVWGDNSYELANFTDDQLIAALTQLAHDHNNPDAESSKWRECVRQELQKAREDSCDIKVALGRLRIPVEKIKLEELLLPDLLAQLSQESGSQSPVVTMVEEVNDLVRRLSGGSYMLVGEEV